MKKVSQIHQGKTPVRRHFLKEWLEARDMEPRDLIEGIDTDRSTVYRWLKGQLPQPAQQKLIASFLSIEPEDLLRHPDDDWISRFFQGRSAEERDRIKRAMELAWPLKTGSDDR